MRKRPNILLITADQWRGDCVGVAGHPLLATPNVDRLASDGVLFARHFANTAPCGPSRASLLTGLYPHNHRAVLNGTPLDGRHSNIALEARKAGYEPTLFGYTDITPDPRELPPGDPALGTYEGTLKGFSVGVRLNEDGRPWLDSLRRLGYDVPGPGFAIYRADPSFPLPPGRGTTFAPPVFAAEHSETAWLTDQVLDHLGSHGDDPFFLHVSYLRPHPPFIAPRGYHEMYHLDEVPAPRRAADVAIEAAQHPFLAQALATIEQSVLFRHGNGRACDLTDADVRQIRATYFGLISEVDHHIGRLLDALADKDLYDDTLIVLTSDHGEQLGDHHLFGKLGYFDESFHIPLLIKPPAQGRMTGGTVASFTEAVDVMPTVLDVAGIPTPAQCDGRSLVPFLHGERPDDWRDAAHWSFDFRDPLQGTAGQPFGLPPERCNLTVLRDERYKYVHFNGLPPLLFELREDPDELQDLSSEPGHAATLLDYARRMLDWRMSHEYGALHNMLVTPDGLIDGRGGEVL